MAAVKVPELTSKAARRPAATAEGRQAAVTAPEGKRPVAARAASTRLAAVAKPTRMPLRSRKRVCESNSDDEGPSDSDASDSDESETSDEEDGDKDLRGLLDRFRAELIRSGVHTNETQTAFIQGAGYCEGCYGDLGKCPCAVSARHKREREARAIKHAESKAQPANQRVVAGGCLLTPDGSGGYTLDPSYLRRAAPKGFIL